jgi:hypothetical protein
MRSAGRKCREQIEHLEQEQLRDRQIPGRVAADHLTPLPSIAVTVASAEVQWRFGAGNGRPHLEVRDRGEEADTDFWASCRTVGDVDIGIGASAGVGKGPVLRDIATRVCRRCAAPFPAHPSRLHTSWNDPF